MGAYVAAGLPGLTIGFALPVSDQVGVRADFTSVGTRRLTRTEAGIDYDARLKADRIGAYADWFPFGGGFRLTAGFTSNDYQGKLAAVGAGRVLTLGNNSYTLQASDRFDVEVGFPRTTPYVGIGWGHRPRDTGFGFQADIGASLGRATVATRVSGDLAKAPTIAADVAQEEAQLRDTVGKIRFVPQISLGVHYRH